jgi:hypothetical protein
MGPSARATPALLRAVSFVALGFVACQFPAYAFTQADGSGVEATGGRGGAESNAGQGGQATGGQLSAGASSGGDAGAAGAPDPRAGAGGAPAPGAGGEGGVSAELCTSGVPLDASCHVYDGRRYFYFADWESYAVAANSCASLGMALVVVEDVFENDWLQTMALAQGDEWIWLGGSDQASEGYWEWNNGVGFWQGYGDGSPVDGAWVNWLTDEPNGSGSCLLSIAGEWDDYDCIEGMAYVCESP